MNIPRNAVSSALVWVAASSVGCGGGGGAVQAPTLREPVPGSPVARFLPLNDGWQWAYDVEDEGGNRGMFVTRARRLTGARFSLGPSPASAHVVEARADGIWREESETYVLKAPLAAGSTWLGGRGATIKVGAVDRVVETPAGKFVGCLTTIEEAGASDHPERRVTTTYCPDVGVTEVIAEAWMGTRHQRERAVLRSFGKPVDLGGKASP